MRKKRSNVGLAPGSIVYTGERDVEEVIIHTFNYNQTHFEEKSQSNKAKVVINELSKDMVNWRDVRGVHDPALIALIGKQHSIHPLILEDVADIGQRPKFEEYENGNFFIIKALSYDRTLNKVSMEQVSFFFNNEYLISFQEEETDLFSGVRERLENSKGKIRQRKGDYLAYALIDTIVDNYFNVLDEIESRIQFLEDQIINKPDKNIKTEIHQLKKELIVAKKTIFPLREAIAKFTKYEGDFIHADTLVFLRDLYDHTIQIIDLVESYRDSMNGLQDLYLSEISYKMNQVMQILTIISVIFVPLTFLAGIYGMNFDVLPELHWKYGYLYFWGLCIVILGLLLWYFKRKNWL